MRKDAKKTSRKQAKKADVKDLAVKDLAVKNPAAVKGGKVSVNDISFVHSMDKSSPVLMQ